MLITYLSVALGGAIGSVGRFWLSGLIAEGVGQTFPWGTLLVNVTGSFAIGLFATLSGADGRLLVSPDVRAFVMLGICGGYTTFSSFSLQTLVLLQDGQWLKAGLNSAFSLVFCLIAVWLGHILAVHLNTQ